MTEGVDHSQGFMVPPLRPFRRAPPPLVVDVDGGLLACDPVRAGLRGVLRHRPAAVLRAARTRVEQRPFALQELLAEPGAPLPRLPVRRAAVDMIGLWQRFGAPVVLISHLPEAMLSHLRDALCPGALLFGARPARPLGAADKAELLAAVYGRRGFDLLARAQDSWDCALLARRAMLAGLTRLGKRRLLTGGVRASALPAETGFEMSVLLRAGTGWAVDWTSHPNRIENDVAAATLGTRRPNQDVSGAAHSRRGRAGRS